MVRELIRLDAHAFHVLQNGQTLRVHGRVCEPPEEVVVRGEVRDDALGLHLCAQAERLAELRASDRVADVDVVTVDAGAGVVAAEVRVRRLPEWLAPQAAVVPALAEDTIAAVLVIVATRSVVVVVSVAFAVSPGLVVVRALGSGVQAASVWWQSWRGKIRNLGCVNAPSAIAVDVDAWRWAARRSA
jgi:hypothetical protein